MPTQCSSGAHRFEEKVIALQLYGLGESKLCVMLMRASRSSQKGHKTTTLWPQSAQDVPIQRISGALLQQQEHSVAISWSWKSSGASPLLSKRQRSLQEGCTTARTWSWESRGGPVVQISGPRLQEQRHSIAIKWSWGVPRCLSSAEHEFEIGRAKCCKITRPMP